MNALRWSIAIFVPFVLAGCQSYLTPGGPVSIPELTQPDIAEALARKPAAPFPARLIVARVQAAHYKSAGNEGYGEGRYSVLTTRDIETDYDFNQLGSMQGVAAVGVLSRVLLPASLDSAKDLRTAAAQLRGDIVLPYTLDTSFRTEAEQIGPLQLVGLGFFPNHKAHVTATCAAAFIDVRTGFVYGIAESTATEQQRSDLWRSHDAIDKARLKAEREAFSGALKEIERAWASIYREHGAAASAAGTQATGQ